MKRTLRNLKITLFIFFVALFIGCESKKSSPVLVDSNGRINHLLLVVKNSHWQTKIGDKLREIIGTPVIGMPQEENQFDISRVPPDSFGKMFKASRNVLLVELGKENIFQTKRNVYAKPQQIVKVSGIDETAVIDLLEKNKATLLASFKDFDIENIQKAHRKKSYPKNTFKTLENLGVSMTIPNTFKKVDDTGTFLWLRQHLSGGIAKGDSNSNILVYTVPVPEDKTDLIKTISQIRDTIGKKHLLGRNKNMFMITEKAFTPKVFETRLNGKTIYKTHGKWEVLNDFMAGPFLNYTIENLAHNRWLVIEGFTYAPSVNKRDYMFELEAILKTVQF